MPDEGDAELFRLHKAGLDRPAGHGIAVAFADHAPQLLQFAPDGRMHATHADWMSAHALKMRSARAAYSVFRGVSHPNVNVPFTQAA